MKNGEPRTEPATNPRRRPSPLADIPLTHPDKLLYPDDGITKAEVVDYYGRMAPRLLPYFKDRPATLERVPDGVGRGAHFWQKNTPRYYPDWIPRVDIPTGRGKSVHYVLVNDVETLLYLVNQGTLTFHVWMSRVGRLDQPDHVLFDLDPSGGAFADVVAVAQRIHKSLSAIGRQAFVKTSGKRGLHVLVPWEAGDYDRARAWAIAVANRVAAEMPRIATREFSKSKRGGKVYIDVLQNIRGHHVVPPYVLRAAPGAGVSTPLRWSEVKPDLDPHRFTLRTIFRRLVRQKRDPMAPFIPSLPPIQ